MKFRITMQNVKVKMVRIFVGLLVLALQFSLVNIAYATNPEARAHYEKGKELLYSGDEGMGPHIYEAITAFEKAIQIDPDLVNAYLLLSDAYRKTLIPLEYQSAEWKEVLRKSKNLIRKAVKIAPENTKVLDKYLMLVKDRAEIIKIYQKMIELEPDHAYAHATYAYQLYLLGNKNKAIKEYLTHVRINDKDKNGFIHSEYIGKLWGLLTEQDRKDEAVELMKRFLLGPYPPAVVSTTLRNTIDTSTYTEDKYQSIIKKVNQFQSYGNDKYYQQAQGFLDMDQLTEAMETFSQHIEVNPYNTRYYIEFAKSLASHSYYKEAYGVYESLLDSELKQSDKCFRVRNLRLRVDFIGSDRSLPKKIVKECGHKVVLIQ
ncbi:MAG: hypothetical protein GY820_47795 [Gammaproteobacteria bacterium]|nr:hypothetical protein [Gammaproteobacteria bacterium]